MKFRNKISKFFFQKENFVHIDAPSLSVNDCEGAGDIFIVQVCLYAFLSYI